MENTRRDFIKVGALAAGALVFGLPGESYAATDYPYTLPALAYSFDALEPYIDAKTMQIHHDKHHQVYVDKLNAALEKYPDFQGKFFAQLLALIPTLPEDLKSAVTNFGGGHWNHTHFWQILSPTPSAPTTELSEAINAKFGSLDKLKEEMTKQGMSVFGSGWVWLIETAQKELKVVTTTNQNNPIMGDAKEKGAPILGIDVWEHAYYLKYQNGRADYLKNIWNVINWKRVSDLYF